MNVGVYVDGWLPGHASIGRVWHSSDVHVHVEGPGGVRRHGPDIWRPSPGGIPGLLSLSLVESADRLQGLPSEGEKTGLGRSHEEPGRGR